MQLRQAAVILLTSTVILTQLSGCAAVAPDKGIENSDDVAVVTEETNANSTAANADTVTVGGEQYDVSETPAEQVEQEEISLTTEELHALFKKEYEFFKWAKANLYDDQYQTYYLKLPAREIGTQTDANVYSDIEKEVSKPDYDGKKLPDDGFEQYVEWRKALESSSKSNSTTTGSTSNEQQKPSGSSNNNSGNSESSGNNEYYDNVYEGATVEREVHEAGKGMDLIESDYEKPSYEIVG